MVTGRLLTVLTVLSGLACQDLIGLTAGKPDPSGSGGTGGNVTTGGGGDGTTASSGGGGSTAGGGGTGGSTTAGGGGTGGTTSGGGGTGTTSTGCSDDCTPSGPCETAECVEGVCVVKPKEAGTFVENPAKGDCKAGVCDGYGAVIDAPWFDPDDGNECTWDACADGVAGHLPVLDGSPCNFGNGVCAGGQCQPGDCAPPNMAKDGTETGIDCGGACEPCIAPGDGCKVTADCGPALFCSTEMCTSRILLAAVVKSTGILLGAFRPAATPAWSFPTSENVNVAGTGVSFDAAGEGVAVTRFGGSGARFARWQADAWPLTTTLLSLSSVAWLPALARTDAGLFVFAQNTNDKHHFTIASGASGDPFLPVESASSPLSGGAGVRQGHASFFYAPIDLAGSLVETRFVGGAWSTPAVVLEGNHADSQPVMVGTETGDLLVAALRTMDEHQLVWRVLAADGPKKQGIIPETLFAPEQPVPKRVALAPLPTGGAILAFRSPSGALDVRVATDDGEGGFTWTPENVFPNPPQITGEPALARGLPGARAELVWIVAGGAGPLRHARWLDDGTWTTPVDALPGAASSVAIATP